MTRRTPEAVLWTAAIIAVSACAPVRIIEDHDPRIEQGMTEYQQALTIFVGETLANYETCSVLRARLEPLEAMECRDGSPEALAMCQQSIELERDELAEETEAACRGASFDAWRRSFYIEQEARLSILKTRASVLDSMGICVSAMQTVADGLGGLLPGRLQGAVTIDGEDKSNNCTEVVVGTVLENHQAMALNHRCIDDPTLDICPPDYAEENPLTWDSSLQASFFFPTMLDTLQQNIQIVLFLEEAKKRGDDGDGG